MRRSTAPSARSSRKRARRASSLILIVAFTGGVLTPTTGTTQVDEIDRLLDARARAVRAGDRAAFRATMRGAPRAFVADRMAWFDRMQALPVDTYTLARDPSEYLDLSGAAERPLPPGAMVLVVEETIRLADVDTRPSVENLFLTLVPDDAGTWSIHGDDALDDFGLFSGANLWDLGDVTVLPGERVLTITRGAPGEARAVADSVEAAIDRVAARWPLRWPERTVLAIPADAADLGRIFQTTVDLSPFVAFAASGGVFDDDAEYVPGAPRVYLQPETFSRQPEGFRTEIIGHEMLHVAASAVSGWFVPAWLDEGVAQFYGERITPATDLLSRGVRDGTHPGRVPEDHEYFLGSDDEIGLSYQAAVDVVGLMAERFGEQAPARFYRAVGRESNVSFGMPRYHLDRAGRRSLGRSFTSIERAWVRDIEARFG